MKSFDPEYFGIPNMRFTVDGRLYPFGGYRLQKDGKWREIEEISFTKDGEKYTTWNFKDVKENDLVLDNLVHSVKYRCCDKDFEIDIRGMRYKVNQTGGSLSELTSGIKIKPTVHRLVKPRLFTLDEVRDVIAGGNDSRHNFLIVDLEGYARLICSEERNNPIAPIAARMESFVAGNGYVGIDAVKDEKYVRGEYLCCLEGWKLHLMKGELKGDLIDDLPEETENELITEITELTKNLS